MIRPSLLAACAFLSLATAHAGETLVQVSTIDALIKGLYQGALDIGTLKQHGNFGIGTLDQLDGEMVALDGKVFQASSDGKVRQVPDTATTPFAAVTDFHPDAEFQLGPVANIAELAEQLDKRLPNTNQFFAIRLTGTFKMLSLRSVAKQAPPFAPLTEVVKSQAQFHFEDVRGTLVGFRCPAFAKGLNVTGYHFHFLSEDRTRGGHLLDCQFTTTNAAIDTLPNIKVLLPNTPEFLKADFAEHDPQAVEAVEKARR